MLMTSHERDQAIKRYLLTCIDLSGYEGSPTLRDVFHQEYEYEIAKLGEQRALSEWLRGLPSACTVDFYNGNILELCEEWELIAPDASEAKKDRMLDQYWTVMASKLLQIMNGYHVPETH